MQTQRHPADACTFLVEGYWPSGSDRSFREATASLEASLEHVTGARVTPRAVAATLVSSDQAAYWVVDAPSQEVVAQACAAAGLRVERIVGVLEVRAGSAVGPVPARGERHHGRRNSR